MLHDLPALQNLINQLRKVPYLASKNVYRVALHFLTSNQQQLDQFCQSLQHAKNTIRYCVGCYNFTQDHDQCFVCRSPKRDNGRICVVQTWQDLLAIERSGEYNGLYHVLGGALCPLEGVGPEDLTIDALCKRVAALPVNELIFATDSTPEGEATASYITTHLPQSKKGITISRLASGIPTGSHVEYMDRITIAKALSGRRPF